MRQNTLGNFFPCVQTLVDKVNSVPMQVGGSPVELLEVSAS